MRNRFARTCTTLSAGVAVTTMLGLSLAGAASASTPTHSRPMATTACASNCLDYSSLLLGTGTIINAYVNDAAGPGKVGDAVNMERASNSHQNMDFTDYVPAGPVSSYCGSLSDGYLFARSSFICHNYGADIVTELNYSPYGNETGLCLGVATAGMANENLSLQNCGSSARTLFISDANHAVTRSGHLYEPLINGADTSFGDPLVITVNEGSMRPMNQLQLQREHLLTGGVAEDAQLFTVRTGAVS